MIDGAFRSQYGYTLLGSFMRSRKDREQCCGERGVLTQRDFFSKCFPIINHPEIHSVWQRFVAVHDSDISCRTQPRSLLQARVGNTCVQRRSAFLLAQFDAALSFFLGPVHGAGHPVNVTDSLPYLIRRVRAALPHLPELAAHHLQLATINAGLGSTYPSYYQSDKHGELFSEVRLGAEWIIPPSRETTIERRTNWWWASVGMCCVIGGCLMLWFGLCLIEDYLFGGIAIGMFGIIFAVAGTDLVIVHSATLGL